MQASANSAELILAGPRGRRFCLAVCKVSVFSFPVAELDKSDTSPTSANDDGPIRWVENPPVNERVAESVSAAVSDTWRQRRSAALTDQETFHSLGAATQSVMYWQPPDDEDQRAAMAPVIAALRPIAEAAARSASTAWWTRDLQLHDQHFVSWIQSPKGRRAQAPMLTGAAERLKSWRRAALGPSSWWWSFPDAVSTSPSHATLPATQLDLLEDSLGFTRARVARLEPTAGCRVLELTTPQDWVDLVDAHPLDVTRSRDQHWPDVTGGRKPWLIPDWLAARKLLVCDISADD